MAWVYWQSAQRQELMQGPFRKHGQALDRRTRDESLGIACSGIYWSNRSGTSTARGELPPAAREVVCDREVRP